MNNLLVLIGLIVVAATLVGAFSFGPSLETATVALVAIVVQMSIVIMLLAKSPEKGR